MKTRRMRKNKRTRSKRGGGGCFGAFCSTNNATKNVINVSKMDIAALNNKHIELLLSRGIKTTKFVETSDPKVRDRLEKEISELDKEIKVYEDAIAKETRRMNENRAKSTATFDRVHQQMKNANPVHSQNYSEFFKDIKRPTPISGGRPRL